MSAVHRGTAFEQRALRTLQSSLSMSLRRVGGRSDGGVDLVGWWWLPLVSDAPRSGALTDPDGLPRRRLRVLAQCKAERKKLSPKYVREMEGVWHLHAQPPSPPPSPSPASLAHAAFPTVALLLSESPFSRATVLQAYRSTVPFLLVHLPRSSPSFDDTSTHTDSDSEMSAVCPNPTLTHLVQPLAFRWERSPAASDPAAPGGGGRPGLWWHGHRLASWTPDFPVLG